MSASPRRAAALVLAVLVAQAGPASAEKFTGMVTRVIDGDTLIVRYLEQHVSVQLEGVDAPERGEPYARRSAASLARLCSQRPARVESERSDPFGRVLGEVMCNGVNVNEEQLRLGMGRLDAPSESRADWRKLQREARSAKRGIWSDTVPTAR